MSCASDAITVKTVEGSMVVPKFLRDSLAANVCAPFAVAIKGAFRDAFNLQQEVRKQKSAGCTILPETSKEFVEKFFSGLRRADMSPTIPLEQLVKILGVRKGALKSNSFNRLTSDNISSVATFSSQIMNKPVDNIVNGNVNTFMRVPIEHLEELITDYTKALDSEIPARQQVTYQMLIDVFTTQCSHLCSTAIIENHEAQVSKLVTKEKVKKACYFCKIKCCDKSKTSEEVYNSFIHKA